MKDPLFNGLACHLQLWPSHPEKKTAGLDRQKSPSTGDDKGLAPTGAGQNRLWEGPTDGGPAQGLLQPSAMGIGSGKRP